MKTFCMVLLSAALAGAAAGCSDGGSADSPPRMVFIDLETDRPVLQEPTSEAPAVNATTGRRTLMPALYCPGCGAWRPVPPLDVAQRRPDARQCRECRAALTADGPLPDSPAP